MAESAATVRLGAARDRILGAAFWYGVSFVLPADWKWLAWLAASIGVCLALWNAEQGWVERNLARVSLSDL